MFNRVWIRNKLLQMFYRPHTSYNGLFDLPAKTLSAFNEIEKGIEEKVTPLLSEFFE